jgi:hypothetical protein
LILLAFMPQPVQSIMGRWQMSLDWMGDELLSDSLEQLDGYLQTPEYALRFAGNFALHTGQTY